MSTRTCTQSYGCSCFALRVLRSPYKCAWKLIVYNRADPFFSITLNDVELSIFASAQFLDKVFGPLLPNLVGVEITQEAWVVLQVEQHGDCDYEKSGNRVLELAEPLAAEGISILYCST